MTEEKNTQPEKTLLELLSDLVKAQGAVAESVSALPLSELIVEIRRLRGEIARAFEHLKEKGLKMVSK